jgi:ubiquinone/menaquinone biosynthesis C-methylase UbiE
MFSFDEFSNRYDKLRTADLDILHIFIDKTKIQENSKILDFGCGTGNYLLALKNMGFNNLYGIDNSPGMLSYAKKKLEANFYLANHYNYPMFEDLFDFIYLIEVIHLIENIELLFDRFNQSLKRGGKIAIVTESYEQINNRFYKEYFPSITAININRYPSIDKILTTFKQFGFTLIESICYKQDSPLVVDNDYLTKIKEKYLSTFALIPQKEFDSGIKVLEEELISKKSFEVKYWGKTILFLKRV